MQINYFNNWLLFHFLEYFPLVYLTKLKLAVLHNKKSFNFNELLAKVFANDKFVLLQGWLGTEFLFQILAKIWDNLLIYLGYCLRLPKNPVLCVASIISNSENLNSGQKNLSVKTVKPTLHFIKTLQSLRFLSASSKQKRKTAMVKFTWSKITVKLTCIWKGPTAFCNFTLWFSFR